MLSVPTALRRFAPAIKIAAQTVFLAAFAVMLYGILTGLPVQTPFFTWKLKNFKIPFTIGLVSGILSYVVSHTWSENLLFWEKIKAALSQQKALFILFLVYSALFTWQQLREYGAIQINFIPFSFYDYMVFYYFKGYFHFTGLLHEYYHINNILYLFAPVWKIFQSPLLFIWIYGPLAAAAIFPLYALSREKIKENWIAWIFCFIYLNFRYLQNLLQMNFCIEILYPFFIFSCLYAGMKQRWLLYYTTLLLGLAVKEDSFLYFSALSLLVFFLNRRARKHAIISVVLAVSYYLFFKWFTSTFTHNMIFSSHIVNYIKQSAGDGNSENRVQMLTKNPLHIFSVLFGSGEKWKTYWNLVSRLAFLPLFSPALVLILAPLLPLFLHHTGRDLDFINLRFHYAAAVIPFIMIAFVYGSANLYAFLKKRKQEGWFLAILFTVVFINSGHFHIHRVTPANQESIQWAQSIPSSATVVTQGHLIPYLKGHREYNFYLAAPWENPQHRFHKEYSEAEYYLLDLNVNPYPMDEAFVKSKIQSLRENPQYKEIKSENGRHLFKRR